MLFILILQSGFSICSAVLPWRGVVQRALLETTRQQTMLTLTDVTDDDGDIRCVV